MNESQTRFLIQRELDGNLSAEEESRLRRVLMVSDSAVSFRANLSQIVAMAKDLDLPDDVRPGDSSQLAVEIIDKLPVVKGNFWDPLFDIFTGRKSSKTDLRSTRSVGSAKPFPNTSGKGTGLNSSASHPALTDSGSRSKIDPAVLSPKKETTNEMEDKKTPPSLPAIDQYLTGTHSAVGGLAKKLRKDLANTQAEDVGKTLANAIREKVHESINSAHDPDEQSNALIYSQSQMTDTESFHDEVYPAHSIQPPIDQRPAVAALETTVAPIQSFTPVSLLPVATTSMNISPANITTQDRAISVNLGSSMVLTVAPQVSVTPAQHPQTPPLPTTASKGHDFAEDDLMEWKSGSYPAVPPPVRPWSETQAETGPLTPFPVKTSLPIAKFNLKDTAEIMKQLDVDSQKEKLQFPQWQTATTSNSEPAPERPAVWPTYTPQPWDGWVPPPTPENAAPPADPWAPPKAPVQQLIQDPWAPLPVQATNPWLQHQVPASDWAPPAPTVPAAAPVPLPASVPNPGPVPAPAPLNLPAPHSAPVQKAAPSEAAAPKASDEEIGYQPTIVPVTRNPLPIEAIGERINLLFSEPAESKPPTVVSQPAKEVDPARQKNTAMENDVKECLSSIGRLADLRYATNNPGHIKDLGRFLLTDETRESIGICISKGLEHSHARVITLEAAQQLAVVLEPVRTFRGVIGYMVCGYDGLPVTYSLPQDVDIELLGGCALVTFMNSHSIMKVMGHTRVNQMILNTPGGCMLLADFGKGILVTLTNDRDAAMLAQLTDTIASISDG